MNDIRRRSELATSGDLGEVLEFMRLLWQVYHGLQSRSKRMAGTMGITGPQRLVILLVGRFPGISAGDLADLLCVHPSTLTGTLRRLVNRRLVVRTRDPADRRRSFLRLTRRGSVLGRLRVGTVESAVRRGLSPLSAMHLNAARSVLRALGDELQASR
ncbi:MAG: MarR family transcriptional regulator [Acidobacteriota bacterium]